MLAKHQKKSFSKKWMQGHTLMELAVIMGLIGFLSMIVVVSLSTSRKRSRDSRRISAINAVRIAAERFAAAKKYYPVPADGAGEIGYCALANDTAFMKFLPVLEKDPLYDTASCNGGLPSFGYEYFAINPISPREALVRVYALELPKPMRTAALAEDLDGPIAPITNAATWIGGAKAGLPNCNTSGNPFPCICSLPGCNTVDCGDPANDNIYCMRLE